jgi:hypothetical protein
MDTAIRYRPGRRSISEVIVRKLFRGRRTAPALHQVPAYAEASTTDRWEPLPDDIAEWMGMRPYCEAREAQAAS